MSARQGPPCSICMDLSISTIEKEKQQADGPVVRISVFMWSVPTVSACLKRKHSIQPQSLLSHRGHKYTSTMYVMLVNSLGICRKETCLYGL